MDSTVGTCFKCSCVLWSWGKCQDIGNTLANDLVRNMFMIHVI